MRWKRLSMDSMLNNMLSSIFARFSLWQSHRKIENAIKFIVGCCCSSRISNTMKVKWIVEAKCLQHEKKNTDLCLAVTVLRVFPTSFSFIFLFCPIHFNFMCMITRTHESKSFMWRYGRAQNELMSSTHTCGRMQRAACVVDVSDMYKPNEMRPWLQKRGENYIND